MRGDDEHSPLTRSVDQKRHSDLIIWQNLLLLAIISLVAVMAGVQLSNKAGYRYRAGRQSMMEESRPKLSLDRPATYQIKVPGHLDDSWADWVEEMTISVQSEGEGPPVTTLTGSLDQAALQGLLRRLYSLGLPLVSVICLECGLETGNCSCQNKEGKARE